MSYKLDIKENQDYLKVEISGDWTPGAELEDSVNVWAQVTATCNEKGVTHIMAIWNVPGYLPTMAAYNLVESAEKFGWDKRLKLAVVHLNEERLKDGLVAETLAVDRGFNIKMFNNEQKAKLWLMES